MSKEATNLKKEKKDRRHLRIRAKVSGTAKRPRLSVFRSNAHLYVQLIDDVANKTLAHASDAEIKEKKSQTEKNTEGNKVATARKVGSLIAEKAKKLGLEAVVFDRGGVKYHGRIKAVAEGAREGGLKF